MRVLRNEPDELPLPARVKPSDSPESPLGVPALHESGLRHTSGEALYVDDLPMPKGGLYGWIVTSPHPHARIVGKDATAAKGAPGVHAVLFADDVPGENQVGTVVHDEELLASEEVHFRGQTVALVVAESATAARKAAALVEVEYEPLPAVFTFEEALAAKSFLTTPHEIRRGDVDAALASCAVRITGEASNGAQDHFYLETHCSLAVPKEGGTVEVISSTQHPSEVQSIVAEVLGIGRNQVVVEVLRMGGGFGGKETQAAPFAALAAMAASATGRPVKVWLNRDQDMAQTGKRHPFWTRYEAGLDARGVLTALKVEMYADGGFSNDLSGAILDRGLFHLDNSYFIPNLAFFGQVVRTNLPSNTAFRGFGGPQGMLVVEEVLSRAAERLKLDPAEVRRRNFYGESPRNLTPYGQEVTENRLERVTAELLESADYARRREAIDRFNREARWTKRGIAFQTVKFGISFTTSMLNQAGAFVLVYGDGTVQLNHGGTEMGQGLHTKMLTVCAHELGVPLSSIRMMNTATDKVPNTSATAASSGADLNGQAVAEACSKIRERLRPIAARLLRSARSPKDVVFAAGKAHLRSKPARSVSFREVVQAAYQAQISLSATGYYRTPNIHYDRVAGRGKPFHYFAYGAVVAEVELSGLTGEHRLRRVDILHDVGSSLVPTVDRGQVEGGFIQGYGWLTCEEVRFDREGRLLTHSPDTYKVPAMGEAPEDFRIRLLERAPQPDTIHGSKAVGEPPLMLAIAAVSALRHGIGSFAPAGHEVQLRVPCTAEAILDAVEIARARPRD